MPGDARSMAAKRTIKWDRALEEANRILSQPNPARFSDELDAKVRPFPNLVKECYLGINS